MVLILYLGTWSPFPYGILLSNRISYKIAAMGGDYRKVRLTFQEYFEKLGNDEERWGKPFVHYLGHIKLKWILKYLQ